MTSTEKPVSRRTVAEHPKHKKRLVVTLDNSLLSLRLERSSREFYLDLNKLFDQAELQAAVVQTGANIEPCSNPKRFRNV